MCSSDLEAGYTNCLLIIAKYPEVLFQGLIGPFRLAVTLGMVSGREVQLHVQCFTEGVEETGYEFGAAVGGDMFGDSVFGEHVHNEQHGKVFGGTMDGCQDEYALF